MFNNLGNLNKKLRMMVREALGNDAVIAFENRITEPDGARDFFEYSFHHAVNEQLGKCGASGEFDEGFIQVSSFVPLGTQDIAQMDSIDKLRAYFNANSRGTITITSMTISSAKQIDAWFVRDLTIYWAYTEQI